MNLKPRSFLVDEDDHIRRIPYARFARIHERRQRMHLFAGKCIRAIFVVVQIGEDRVETFFRANFTKWMFDEDGLLDEEYKMASLRYGRQVTFAGRGMERDP